MILVIVVLDRSFSFFWVVICLGVFRLEISRNLLKRSMLISVM